MEQTIRSQLKNIERQYDVRILFACESGSRAWGFPSPDSDYDVRFVYVHPLDWYLNVFEQRDVIELPIDDVLDIGGWELRKTLKLLYRCNPTLQEWLTSPIVYQADTAILAQLQQLARESFLPKSSCHHYLALSHRYLDKLASQTQMTAKACLYAARALLCSRWVIEHGTQPPMRFAELLAEFLPDGDVRDEFDQLLAHKAVSDESVYIEKPPLLENYLNDLFAELEPKIPPNPTTRNMAEFNRVFRSILTACEGNLNGQCISATE